MIAKDLFAQIRKNKGMIFVSFNNSNDTFYSKVNKKDLLFHLAARFNLDAETGFYLDDVDGFGYLCRDYLDQ